MPAHTSGLIVAGFGAGTLDVYLPKGVVTPDYKAGAKKHWRGEQDDALLASALRSDSGAVQRLGGNILNFTAAWAHHRPQDEVRFASVLGDSNDIASQAIRDGLPKRRIANYAEPAAPGYNASVGLIYRAEGDRMTRGQPRGPMEQYLTAERIAAAAEGAGVIAISSLKDVDLLNRVLQNTPSVDMLSVNPGSREVKNEPEAVVQAMRDRGDADLLAINDEELRYLFSDDETPLEKLILRATALATNVLCTRGKEGAMWGYNGEVLSANLNTYDIQPLRPDEIEDPLGAGDSAHEAAARALAEGYPAEYALEQAIVSPLPLLAVVGAHGHIPLHD